VGLAPTIFGIAAAGTVAGFFVAHFVEDRENVVAIGRNFFGVLQVEEYSATDAERHVYRLRHGRIMHGKQFASDKQGLSHTSYYGKASGVGVAMAHHPDRHTDGRQFRVGVIGLGVGTIASYTHQGDYLAFYDINPLVVDFAEKYFTYLPTARARGVEVQLFLGDARIVMERQLAEASQQFDVLVVDAFSSDAIPIHLLTEECFGIYWQHLKPDGILAVHISNRYLDLSRVVRKLADVGGKTAVFIDQKEADKDERSSSCDWILVTSNAQLLGSQEFIEAQSPWESSGPPVLWTDDFSSLYDVLDY
jgi:hypothetical protein